MILVTTAGKVGASAARVLAQSRRPVRVLVRDPSSHRDLAALGVELLPGDLDRADSIAAAVEGVQSIILVTPAALGSELAVIEAARRAGVPHVVKVTSDASADSPIGRRRDHHRIEQALVASGLPHTLLRSNAFLQNLLALAPGIAATSGFSSSTGDGRIGMVDARDVGEAAATVAADPAGHEGRTYRLSGPESLSYDDVARRLTSILGRTVTHRRITTEQQEAALVELGLPEPIAHANALALALFAEGDSDWTGPDLGTILGRRPIGFDAFVADYIARFSPV